MPPSLARRRLPALLAVLRANGVTSYDDGTIKLTLALSLSRAEPTNEFRDTRPKTRQDEPAPRRAPMDATDLAIRGIKYDPEADEPAEAKA